MKKFIIIGIIAVICAGCGGSSSVDKAIGQVEKAIEKIEKNKGNMTESDWKAIEQEVEEPLQVIQKALEDDKVGIVKKGKLSMLAMKWAAVVMEAGLNTMEKEIGINREDWNAELEKAAGELEKALEELEKAKEEIEAPVE